MPTTKTCCVAFLLFLLLPVSRLFAQEQPVVDITDLHLAREIKKDIALSFVRRHEDIFTSYPTIRFHTNSSFDRPIPNKDVMKYALLRFSVANHGDTAAGVFFFPGFYYRSITLFHVVDNRLEQLPDSMPSMREKWGYRYFSVPAHDTMVVVARLEFLRTYINKIRPRLVSPGFLPSFIGDLHNINSESDLTTYLFCGLFLMMILYSLASYFQGGNTEFLYYSGYAVFIGLMLLLKALYNYHTQPVNYFIEEYLDFIMQGLGIIFYMLFMQRFLGTRSSYPFLHRLYNFGVIFLAASIFAYTGFHYFTENFSGENLVENLTKLVLLAMVVIFLLYSSRHWNDRLLRYLFWGNLFYLLFSLFSLALILFPRVISFSGLAGNSLLYYEAGLFVELVFFLAGLNHKNRRRLIRETQEREMLKAQNVLKEFEKEMAVYKAQQEERNRISADMHDELGSGITAIRLMSEIARNKMKEQTPAEIDRISQSADDVLNKMNAIIWSMNSSNDTLDNLLVYIRTYAIEYFETTQVNCKVSLPEQVPAYDLAGEKRRNIFLCVKESLNNVLKHAQATEVKIDITVGERLVIRISDDGKGIEMEKLRMFGNGLKNIARRMHSIGGTFRIENAQGTITTLELPL